MWYRSGMRILPLLCAAALLSPDAKADKFWFGDAAAEKVEGSEPAVIEGVLIAEDDTSFHVRVVGGEVVLPKARVTRHEKDGLTLDAIAASEKTMRDRAASTADQTARARAAARLRRDVRAAEAAASRRDAVRPVAVSASATRSEAAFDAVIGRVDDSGSRRAAAMRELLRSWKATKDRRYLEELRRMRRMK